MSSLEKLSNSVADKVVVLSVKPKYAELILNGTKTVEFRRAWAAQDVDRIVIYESAPTQRLVGMVSVSTVISDKPTRLWAVCQQYGGGLTKAELMEYFKGKTLGNAVLLKDLVRFTQALAPAKVFRNFSPPQSFRYMTLAERERLDIALSKSKAKK